jgi:hypothetical protein
MCRNPLLLPNRFEPDIQRYGRPSAILPKRPTIPGHSMKKAPASEAGNRPGSGHRARNALGCAARQRIRVTPEEMEHVVLLSITTIGLPAAGRAFTWIHHKGE